MHGVLPARGFRRRGLKQALVDAGADVLGQHHVQHVLDIRFEDVQRRDALHRGFRIGVDRGLRLDELHRQHAQHAHLLHHHVDELGVDDVQLRDAAFRRRTHVGIHQRVGDRVGDLDAGLVGVTLPRPHDVAVAVLVVRHAATTVHVEFRLLAGRVEAAEQRLRLADDRRGIGAGHASVRGECKDRNLGVVLLLAHDRVRDMAVGHHRLDGIEDRISVRLRVHRDLTGLGNVRRRDHLLRVEDLLKRRGGGDP